MRSSSSNTLSVAASVIATTDKENATHVIELGSSQTSSPSSRPADALCRRKRTEDALRATADRRRRRRQDHMARAGQSSTEHEMRRENVHRDSVEPISRAQRSSLNLGAATVSFQRRLARPREVPAVNHANLSLMASRVGCSGHSLADIKHVLRTRAPQMSAALRAVRAAPTSTLPQSLDALVPTEHMPHMPSHFLAVYSRSPANRVQGRRAVTLFPAHDVVLAAYCAKLAPLGAPAAIPGYNAHCGPDGRSFDVSIPVVPLCLPSPRTFGILQHYLYHHTTDALAQVLLPTIPATITGAEDRAQTIRLLSQQIAAVHAPAKINEHVLQAHGLWSNMVVLGISDEALWDALDFFWEVLMDALYIATLVRPDENMVLNSATAAMQPTSTVPQTRNADLNSSSSGAESDSDNGCASDSSRTTSPPTSPLLSKAVQAMDLY